MKIEELKSRIKELNDYFVEKLVGGDYQVIKKESTNITVKISGYMFTFWFGLGSDADYLECTEIRVDQPNFMKLHFEDNKTKKTVRSILISDVTETREAEIERLEEKLKMLKSIKS